MWGNDSGVSGGTDAYGRMPWQSDFNKEGMDNLSEFDSLYRFKGEFAKLFGPYRRGRAFDMLKMEEEKDSEDYHKYHLSLCEKKKPRRN